MSYCVSNVGNVSNVIPRNQRCPELLCRSKSMFLFESHAIERACLKNILDAVRK